MLFPDRYDRMVVHRKAPIHHHPDGELVRGHPGDDRTKDRNSDRKQECFSVS